MEEVPEVTGFQSHEMEDHCRSERLRPRPRSMAWITPELLEKTQRVWSKAYRRPVDEEEATTILANVRRLAEVLLKAKREVQEE